MKVTISLKQLRTDPREYIRLLKSGHEVAITEHRRELVRTKVDDDPSGTAPRGDARALMAYLSKMPKIKTPHAEEDTVTLAKRARREYLESKLGGRK